MVKVVICLQCLSIKIKASYFSRFLLRKLDSKKSYVIRDDLYFRHAHDELNSVLILKSLMACVLLIREMNYDDGKFCLEVNYVIYTQKKKSLYQSPTLSSFQILII